MTKTADLVKVAAAAVGTGVLIAMGALTVATVGDTHANATPLGGAGQTSTQSTAPSSVETPLASPTVTAPAWGGQGGRGGGH